MSHYKVLLVAPLLFFFFFFFFSSSPTSAARHEPAFPDVTLMETMHGDVGVTPEVDQTTEESCEGIGEEECLMRRTLAAHIDYIYTQNASP